MGTALTDQHLVAVAQLLQRVRAADQTVQIALEAREQDRERRHRDARGRMLRDPLERLRIRDHERGSMLQPAECRLQLRILTADHGAVVVEQLAQRLLLRQDDPALGRGFVDRDDQHDGVALLHQIGDDALLFLLRLDQGGKALLELPYPLSCQSAHKQLTLIQMRTRRHEIDFIVAHEIRQLAAVEFIQQAFICRGQSDGTVHYKHGDIGLAQYLASALHAQLAQSAFIIEAGGVDDNDRPQRQQLHCLLHRVGGRAEGVGDNGDTLIGHGIDNARFARVTPPEKGDMRPHRGYGRIQ